MAGIGREILHGTQNLFPFPPEHWPAHLDAPIYLTGHDRDLALQPDYLDWFFSALPAGTKMMSMNHYIAILHTDIASLASNLQWQLTFRLAPQYCTYFATHPSAWKLWLSDPVLERLKRTKGLSFSVDGKAVSHALDLTQGTLVIDLPPGLGTHVWKLGLEE